MLRAQLEAAFGERIHSPFTDLAKRVDERVPIGIAELDIATGGLPRGAITEIVGGLSSGKTTIALSALAAATSREEVCALVDGGDAFDPQSAEAAGLDLHRLLWIRCRTLDQTLRTADMLVQAGGFGLVAIDLSGLPQNAVRNTPLAVWFRFQRTLENTPAILLLIGGESIAKSAAALVVQTSLQQTNWAGAACAPSHARFLSGQRFQLHIARARNQFSTRHVCFDSCSGLYR